MNDCASLKSVSRKLGRARSSSICESGYRRSISMRPASESDKRGTSRTFDEPVRMMRTALRFASIMGLRAANQSAVEGCGHIGQL